MALVGELGTGKTQFIKGLAAGAEVKHSRYISSPSFTLINEYKGKVPFYHIDLYRLEDETEAQELGLEEYFQSNGMTMIEWADKIPSLLPKETLQVTIHYAGKNSRSIEILGKGKRYLKVVDQIQSPELGVMGSEQLI